MDHIGENTVAEFIDVQEGTPDVVLNSGFLQKSLEKLLWLWTVGISHLGCIHHVLSLLELNGGTLGIPVIGDRKDCISPLDGILYACRIIYIGLYSARSKSVSGAEVVEEMVTITYSNRLSTQTLQVLRGWFSNISCNSSNGPAVLQLCVTEDGSDDGTALITSCSKNNEDFLGCHF